MRSWLTVSAKRVAILVAVVLMGLSLAGCSNVHRLTAYARFTDVGDLATKAPVEMDDIRVGEVTGIRLSGNAALVTMALDPSAQVPANVTARVRQTSLLGERIVDLMAPANLPASAPLLHDGQSIRNTEVRPDLEDLVNAGNSALGPIMASEIATLVDEGAAGFAGNGATLHGLLGDFTSIVHAYAGRSDQIQSVIDSLDQLNTTIAARASAQGRVVANSARALDMLRQEDVRLQAAIHALSRLSIGARAILDQHVDQMSRFFSQMRVILGVLRSEESDLQGLLRYAPHHDVNTQLVNYYDNDQVYQDFVICGLNDNPRDPARSCQGGR